jgi:hypothetical protein
VTEWLDGDRRISIAIFINIDEDTQILRKIQAFILEPKLVLLLDKDGKTAVREEHGLSVSDFDCESDQAL